MSFVDISRDIALAVPELRGTLTANEPLAPFAWFRTGGPAQLLFRPADEADLAGFLASIPADLPVMVMGLASNLLIRDGGVSGVVIRLGRGFNKIAVEDDVCLCAGAGVPDAKLAQEAARAGIEGFVFYRGIPGSIGGALRMNAGAHGGETAAQFLSARAVDRMGNIHQLTPDDMEYSYRHCGVPKDYIFTEALFAGKKGNEAELQRQMQDVVDYREENQPVKSRTGGSTFKNPPGSSAWKLIDAAGCRGLQVGGAQVSEKHCNFLINTGNATAADIEELGEMVRKRVKENSGVELYWEIKRVGIVG